MLQLCCIGEPAAARVWRKAGPVGKCLDMYGHAQIGMKEGFTWLKQGLYVHRGGAKSAYKPSDTPEPSSRHVQCCD